MHFDEAKFTASSQLPPITITGQVLTACRSRRLRDRRIAAERAWEVTLSVYQAYVVGGS
jgi:hypothetical protein